MIQVKLKSFSLVEEKAKHIYVPEKYSIWEKLNIIWHKTKKKNYKIKMSRGKNWQSWKQILADDKINLKETGKISNE